MVVLGGVAFSYERGTPAPFSYERGTPRPYPEYSRDNSYPWSPFPPEAGPSMTRSSHDNARALAALRHVLRWNWSHFGNWRHHERES